MILFWFACCRSPEGRISTFSCPSCEKHTSAAAQLRLSPLPHGASNTPRTPIDRPDRQSGARTSSAFSRSSRPSSSSTSSKSSPSKLRETHAHHGPGRTEPFSPQPCFASFPFPFPFPPVRSRSHLSSLSDISPCLSLLSRRK